MESNATMLSFYQLLGRVFYATAQADNEVHDDEIATLKQVVKDQWLNVEDTQDEFGTDAAYQIEIVFDQLLADGTEEIAALEELKAFKSQHPNLFISEVSKLIMDTASKIATAFAKRNKSELVFLSQLFLVLKD